jgi:hypothetical protein
MRSKLITGILSFTMLFAASCKRETMVGTEQGFATKDFALVTPLNVNKTNPNFTLSNLKLNTALFFSAEFNEDVSWTVTVSSDDSGAEMKIKGKGKKVDVSNGWWQGESTGNRFFSTYDTCYAKLNVLGLDTTFTLNKKIVILQTLSYNLRTVDGVKYRVIDDFEKATVGMAGVSADQADNGTPKYAKYKDYSVEGLQSYHMEGLDVNKNGWLLSINHDALTEIAKQVNPADNIQIDNPEDLYFNLYIRGTGQSNTAIELKTYELDSSDSKVDLASIIGTYVYNSGAQANNDGWIYDIVVDWEGWKLVSIPYSKFKPSSDLKTGGNGNRIKEPWKVTGMAVSLLSYPTPGLNVSADIDFVVISEGGPFVPKY